MAHGCFVALFLYRGTTAVARHAVPTNEQRTRPPAAEAPNSIAAVRIATPPAIRSNAQD